MRPLLFALIYVSIPAAIAGGLYLSQITAGVGGLVFACYLGIMARLVQAHLHNLEQR
jgi:hypothetical protein